MESRKNRLTEEGEWCTVPDEMIEKTLVSLRQMLTEAQIVRILRQLERLARHGSGQVVVQMQNRQLRPMRYEEMLTF